MSSHGTDPEDVDAAFAAIVADLRAEGVGEFDEETLEPQQPPQAPQPPRPAGAVPPPDRDPSWRGGGTPWDDVVLGDDPAEDNEHFVPPEPPPLPRPGKGAFVVLLFFLVGLFLLIAPGLIGLSATMGTPLGILSLVIALALLLLRVKQGPPDGADPSNGAQV
ncbi:hypothetical protein ORV05_06935 [Amycolatopsis cynarae]|uniref:DUF308 domain-containing protein n=1 Tax=Amycolatopsis cynarae TaxID=2995223 RepID=A0ABY7B5B3_9PSEU|nr:hypothetical protein [Amycolatopsis sp. HUAS 11-8]WAL67510.1 hypothetical protein ORV05_06935 [Amycolatopsis sp. HUAS 11-8]